MNANLQGKRNKHKIIFTSNDQNKFDFVEKGKSFAQAGHSSAASQAQRSSGLRASVCSILKDNFFYFREAIERAYPKN
jgi:hypothetical protein